MAQEKSCRWEPYLKNPIIVALDVDSAEEALTLAQNLRPLVGGFKVGPRLIVRYGSSLVKELSSLGPVFLDHKFLDIPSTMVAAVRAAFDAGATLVTVHSWAGPVALNELAALEKELNQIRPFLILNVTVLTSFTETSLPPGLCGSSISLHVDELATMVWTTGLTGIVASPHEVEVLRSQNAGAYLVTPGIRGPHDQLGDQKRTMTPEQALRCGASALVIGRPLIKSQDPVRAAEDILQSIQGLL